jgi:hypothetical protein
MAARVAAMDGKAMRFGRNSAVDLLADALRRAEATWQSEGIHDWNALRESEQEEWRELARVAATSVYEELSVDERRVAAD